MGIGKLITLLLFSSLFMFFAYDLIRALYKHNGIATILLFLLGTAICSVFIFRLFHKLVKGKDLDQ